MCSNTLSVTRAARRRPPRLCAGADGRSEPPTMRRWCTSAARFRRANARSTAICALESLPHLHDVRRQERPEEVDGNTRVRCGIFGVVARRTSRDVRSDSPRSRFAPTQNSSSNLVDFLISNRASRVARADADVRHPRALPRRSLQSRERVAVGTQPRTVDELSGIRARGDVPWRHARRQHRIGADDASATNDLDFLPQSRVLRERIL